MKTCPKCKAEVERLKKGGLCPGCREPLYITDGNYRRVSDKAAAANLLAYLDAYKQEKEGRTHLHWFSADPVERKNLYLLMDKARTYLQAQGVDVSLEAFLLDVFRETLKEDWWYKHLDHVRMVTPSSEKRFASQLARYNQATRKAAAQDRRIEAAQARDLEVQYGLL